MPPPPTSPTNAAPEEDVSELEKRLIVTSDPDAECKNENEDRLADPLNPQNWSRTQKHLAIIITSVAGLVTLMSGAMLAPALSSICKDIHTTEAEASLALSIFILGFAFGPMVLAPCSEDFGRRPVWVGGGVWYVIWNGVCGISNNRGFLIFGRLMAGLGASAEFAVSGAIVNDCSSADERGKSMALRSFLPLLGPALGPILGGVMVQHLSWRWLFWILSIFNAVILLLFICFVPESHYPTILARKTTAKREIGGKQDVLSPNACTEPTLRRRIQTGLARPARLLLTEPAIQLISFVLAYQFGILYIMLSTFSTLWTERYNLSPTVSALHYLAIVIGYTLAAQLGGWATDRVWARLKQKNNGITKPEYRVPLMLPGMILIPTGLLWYGWSAQNRLHWIMPDVGVAILGFGLISAGYAAQAYIIEAYLEFNASAFAATQLLKNVFGFVFPIFAPALYNALGYGLGNTVLAGFAVLFGLPIPFVMWKYGERLRSKGRMEVV